MTAKKQTKEKKAAQDALKAALADTFEVTVAAGTFKFKQGTLRQRMTADSAYDDMDDAENTTGVINTILPIVQAQLIEYTGPDLLDVLTETELVRLFVSVRSAMTIDYTGKKN